MTSSNTHKKNKTKINKIINNKTKNNNIFDFFNMTKNDENTKNANNNNKLITRKSKRKTINKAIYKPSMSKPKTKKKTVKIISQPLLISNKTLSPQQKKESPQQKKESIEIINDSGDDITIKYMSKRFYTKTKTARRIVREPLVKDKFAQYLDDNYKKLMKGDYLIGKDLSKLIFNDQEENCICKNIFKKELPEGCKCYDMEKYKVQGKSGATLYHITCNENNVQNPRILKVIPTVNYFVQLTQKTNKYLYLEMSRNILQILISKYVENELPLNTLKTLYSGKCKSQLNQKYIYQLMDEASYGSGTQFLNSILDRKYDDELDITDEDYRYRIIVAFLLQCVFIIGQLQLSPLEFFHGDYKTDNVFVKPYDRKIHKHIIFNINGKDIKVRNMGFIVMVGDFDRASITIHSEVLDKNYRLFSPLAFKPLLRSYVGDLIKTYGDIDPDTYSGEIKLNKSIISYLVPKSVDPTAAALRSSGVRLFRDLDYYTFFIKLLDTEKMKSYIISKKLDTSIMSFMSRNFRKTLLKMPAKKISFTETAAITFDILNNLNEPLSPVMTPDYIRSLAILNYKLFRDV